MSKISWEHVRYFTSHEFDDPDHPGSGQEIDGRLLLVLDKLRHETGWPIIVHRSVGGGVDVNGTHGHSKNSYHLLENGAKAADWHFDTKESIRFQIRTVLRFVFGGIGIYYDWGIPVGFHTDVRPVERFQVWTRRDGQYIYLIQGG
jgi:hypothetical protein